KMANVNAPSGQAPEMAPPIRTDDQILPRIRALVRNVSNVVTNDMFQPWWTLITIINMCLMGKSSGFERPRTPVLQILWSIVKRANIDYAERIWKEFTQSIHTFIEDKQNLSRHTSGKKRATLIVIPSIHFTKLIIHHLQRRHKFYLRPNSPLQLPNEEPVFGYLKFTVKGTKREVYGMPIPGSLITADIQEASYYQEYLAKVAQHQRYLASETGSNLVSPTSKPTKPAKKPKSTVPKEPPRPAALEESMKTAYALPRGPLPPVVIREPESGKYQPLPEVPGKGKAKVIEEESDSEEESEKVVLEPDVGGQYEGQARPNPSAQAKDQTGSDAGAQDEGQAASNPNETSEDQDGLDPGDAGAKAQSIPKQLDEGFTATVYLKVQENLKLVVEEHVLLEEPASSSGTLSSLQHLSKDISFGDQFFSDKPSDADKNAETEVELMVNVPIQQAMSSISLMTSPIIDLTLRPESPKVHQQFKATTTDTTTITTTITTTLPPPQAQQQSTAEAMMVKRIGELEHIMANLIQVNKDIEERLNKHRACLFTLEQLDIPQQMSIAADMKEILHQRMWETESYKSHEYYMQLFEALEKLMNRDHSDELTQDMAEARKKKKKSRESPKTPHGSPSHQPPPPPPPAGPSGPSGAPGASGSS
nr:hypothetical protein [Tanacetum cinerariifolium]